MATPLISRSDVPPAPGEWAIGAAVAAAVALALALWDSRFHVVPTSTGLWRGISDPPGAMRIALSVAGGMAFAFLVRRAPRRWRTPLIALALAGAPLVPVYTAHGLALLAFQGPVLTFVVAGAVAVALVRRMAGARPGP